MRRRAAVPCCLSIAAWLLVLGCDDSSATPDAGPLPVDQCTNAADVALLEALAATTDGGLPDGGVPDGGPYPTSFLTALGQAIDSCTRGECLPNVIADDGLAECIDTCLADTPAGGLSSGCRDCNIEVIYCTTNNCATQCLGSDTSMCEACAAEHCVPRLTECTGLPAPTL